MATSTNCKFEGKLISIENALDIKQKNKSSKFHCLECNDEVRPHSGGGHTKAHFEHFNRNPKCSLSHNSDISREEVNNDSDIGVIYQIISERSDFLINDGKSWLKQLASAKNFVTTPDFKQWTFGKSVNIENGYSNHGGVAKKWLYSKGFINILESTDDTLKQNVISKFKEWAAKIEFTDVNNKFENDQRRGNRFELLVHKSVLDNIKKSNHANTVEGDGMKGLEEYYLRKQRKNQYEFRKRMIQYWEKCCVTGISDSVFLIASHIKPWSECNPNERMDVDNGLLLAASIDFLFDNYFLTFNDDGTAELSRLAQKVYPHFIAIENIRIERPLNSKQKEFMKYHRKEFMKRNTTAQT